MQKTKLHIVAFDVPYPPDYGGAIDIFYKIKSLADTGVEIYLHCYEYGRGHAAELEKFCTQVWYYTRATGLKGLSFRLPYIVYSRRNKELLNRLISIDAPILYEGVHTTFFLNHKNLKDRVKVIRTHNIEHQYYKQLSSKEHNIFKKYFFLIESTLLRKYERSLTAADAFFPLSVTDDAYFSSLYPACIHAFIAPFHPFNQVKTKPGSGDYCFYHGNLSHLENQEAAMYLIKEIAPALDIPFIFAGRNPPSTISQAIANQKNCRLIANPSANEIEDLIINAHINVLPTFQATGMKLKLLYALFCGRHVLVNNAMIHGTGLEDICNIANNTSEFIAKISALINNPFTEKYAQLRNDRLMENYDNATNAARLLTYLQQISL